MDNLFNGYWIVGVAAEVKKLPFEVEKLPIEVKKLVFEVEKLSFEVEKLVFEVKMLHLLPPSVSPPSEVKTHPLPPI